ncbi:hypothetical protein HanRHA438_Chr04g0182671 [Helianthus annuus]|nr:hypothetical protein HanRHA438_Chr04g0182671 [Helianthus annuus]
MLSFPENKKKKKSSSKRKRKRESKRSQEDFEHFKEMLKLSSKELKDMSQLSSIDDAFHLSWESFSQVAVLFIKSRRSPTLNEFREWDVYTRALYLKARSSREGKPPVSYESLKGPKVISLLGHLEGFMFMTTPRYYSNSFAVCDCPGSEYGAH